MFMPSLFGENLFDDFFDSFARPSRVLRPSPAPLAMKTDVKETDEGFELDIDLPGYKKENVSAELKDGYLTVSATTSDDKEEKDENGRYIRRERFVGNCSRSFYVGEEIEQEDVMAKFVDGILKISVPKKESKPSIEEKKIISIEG